MADGTAYRTGRTPVQPRPDRDYSGATFEREYADGEGLERSLFNGANILGCEFHRIDLQHCEFTEALIQESTFADCDISGSDFVLSKVENTTFLRCRFESGEWRDSQFVNCSFVCCDFSHGTTTLCYFDGCDFDAPTAASLDHRAVYHNVYTHCGFADVAMTEAVSARNFGFPPTGGDMRALVDVGGELSLEAFCLLSNHGHYRAVFLADVALALAMPRPRHQQVRAGTITFVSRIVRALAREGRVSATTLIFVELQLTSIANSVSDPILFVAVMSAVIEVRTAILDLANEALSADIGEDEVQTLVIRFDGTLDDRHAGALRETLEEAMGGGNRLRITDVRQGSTIIEMIAVAALGLGTVMTSANYVLRQAAVTIERIAAIKRAIRKLNPPPRPRTSKSRQIVPVKAASVLDVALMPSEVTLLREAVRRHGRLIVEMDEAASIRVSVQ